MAFLATLLAFLSPVRLALGGYLLKNGAGIALRVAPLSVTVLATIVLWATGAWWVKGAVVGLAIAAFALGFDVRGELPNIPDAK